VEPGEVDSDESKGVAESLLSPSGDVDPGGVDSDEPTGVAELALVSGFLSFQPGNNCIVIAEGWPSWIFVAAPLQFCCTKLYSDSISLPWM
jgi:hypothetical protein